MTQQDELARSLVSVRTLTDVASIETLAHKVYGNLTTRPLGDRPNNIGTVRLGSDPALAIVERVTNAMDAVLDLGKADHPDDDPKSPVEAAQQWYSVPKSGMQDIGEKARRSLGERIKVWLDESGESNRPTVVVEDTGIGISPGKMPHTILSLNEDNKVGQKWNMGTYGQGGSSSCGFARATIIFSRRLAVHGGNSEELVGWTIIKEHEKDPELEIMPSYEYIVDQSGEVPTLPASLFPDFEHGTRVTSIAYDLQGWTGPFTTGIWQLFHAALFEPVLPFLITGYRKKDRNYGSRIVIGNAARLERPDASKRGDLEVAHSDSTKVSLGTRYGHVEFNFWVLRRPKGSTSSSEPAASYVKPGDAISITLFGQRQDVEGRQWIKNRAHLPFLYKNMIIQIDANGLTPIAKRELFASTRERATKSELRERIYKQLERFISTDDELKRLNHLEKERLLEKSTSASSDKIRKRLAKFINTVLKDRYQEGRGSNEQGAGGARKKKPGGKNRQRDTSDEKLNSIPTYFKFKRSKITINQGAGAYTWVEIDAKNGYLPEQDEYLTIDWVGEAPGDALRVTQRSKLLGGLSRWYIEAAPNADLKEYLLTATLVTPNGVLDDSTMIEVRQPPEGKKARRGEEPLTGPRVEWVTRDQWEEHDNMGPRSVGYVTSDDEETIIWVNRHFHLLNQALKGRNLTPEAIETRATRYQFPVACALWLQHDQVQKAEPQPSEEYQAAERERMAEAVLVAIDPDVEAALEESED